MASKQKALGLQNWLDVMMTNCYQYQIEGGEIDTKNTENGLIVILNGVVHEGDKFLLISGKKAEKDNKQ